MKYRFNFHHKFVKTKTQTNVKKPIELPQERKQYQKPVASLKKFF